MEKNKSHYKIEKKKWLNWFNILFLSLVLNFFSPLRKEGLYNQWAFMNSIPFSNIVKDWSFGEASLSKHI